MELFILTILVACALCTDPVFLTDYLSNPSAGQGIGEYDSYNGFITIDAAKDSNTFFWFFPSQDGNGGPGGSSMFGLFSENGPFSANSDGTAVIPREWTWNQHYHMLYVDNPVGVGFSYTGSDDGFVTNMKDVGEDLYEALTQFFTVFEQFQANEFYVSGESYGGKYAPAITHKIHEENKGSPAVYINLAGMTIGDGLQDPITQFTGMGELLYYFGMADENEVAYIQSHYEVPFIEYLGEGKLTDAFHVFDEFMNGDFYPYPTYFFNITGTDEYFNFLNPVYPPNGYPQFLNSPAARALMHVGEQAYWDYNATVEKYLIGDWMRSYRDLIPVILDHYKLAEFLCVLHFLWNMAFELTTFLAPPADPEPVMYYNGQNDLILGPPLAEKYYQTLEWSGAKDYRKAQKQVWQVNGSIAGFVRQAKQMTQVVVRDAGHLLPADQPEWAYLMITHFVDGTNWVN